MNQKAKTVGLHLLAWALFVALVAAFTGEYGRRVQAQWLASFALFVLVYVAVFYANASFFLPKFYLKKHYTAYFAFVVLLFAAVYIFQPFDRLVMQKTRPFPPSGLRRQPPQPLPPNQLPPEAVPGPLRQNLDIISLILFVAAWSAGSVQQLLRQWRTTERRAIQAEADKAAAELSFLKAQIHPHFLFNTLNNIYSLAVVKSEHTAAAVLKLSAILRYLTDDVRQDYVPLQSEVDCARNYIDLQKLRLNKKVTVVFTVSGSLADKKIAPLLFMTFIENAFKYGISAHEACTINVEITAGERNITFHCSNRIFLRQEQTDREGVGISNAQKRLNYLYPKKYLLNIDTENETFSVDLTIISF